MHLGKTINVKQLCSTPDPRKWDSLLSYRDNGSPSHERKWKAPYPWDRINSQQAWSRKEWCLYRACQEGRTPLHNITSQDSLSFKQLAGWATVSLSPSDLFTISYMHYTWRSIWWLLYKVTNTFHAVFESVCFKAWITRPGVELGKIWVFWRSINAVRAWTANENQWGSEAVGGYSCVCCNWHFTQLPCPLVKIYSRAIYIRNRGSK